jgi:hypothetical protein
MSAELVADLTDDTEKLDKAIRDLRPGGGTAMYDAIYFACRDKLMQDQPMNKFRRAMVILSDGDDNQSRWTREQALEMAHKADVVIYSISTNRTGVETDGDKILKFFALWKPAAWRFSRSRRRTWPRTFQISPVNCGISTASCSGLSRLSPTVSIMR